MKTDVCKKNENQLLEACKEMLSSIEFMKKYQNADIFNPNSPKFKNFLIESFSYIHPDFHYLSFLNTEDVELEIVKIAKILQILPTASTKNTKVFESMNEDDFSKFLRKLFSLLKEKKENEYRSEFIFELDCEDKISFFKDMNSTLNYLSYDFPIVNVKKLKNCNINNEINSWQEIKVVEGASMEESSCAFEEHFDEIDIEKLLTDLKEVVSTYCNKKLLHKEYEPEDLDVFATNISLTKNILEYKNNLKIINSSAMSELNCKVLSEIENLSENVFFIKRYNNYIKTLKSKIKNLQ